MDSRNVEAATMLETHELDVELQQAKSLRARTTSRCTNDLPHMFVPHRARTPNTRPYTSAYYGYEWRGHRRATSKLGNACAAASRMFRGHQDISTSLRWGPGCGL